MSILDERYVSLTSFKADGTAVSCPAWIVRLDAHTGAVSTDRLSAKVRRITHDPRVTLQTCDAKGRVRRGTVERLGRARLGDAEHERHTERALRRKYRIGVRLFAIQNAVRRWRGKVQPREGCVLIITLEQNGAEAIDADAAPVAVRRQRLREMRSDGT